jgi:hypothetical protein
MGEHDAGRSRRVEGTEVTQMTYHNRVERNAYYAAHREAHEKASKKWRSKQPPEYNIWVRMRQRCRNPNCDDYEFYGGRGIRICVRWDSFANFYADMGPRPSRKHTLDRWPNNNGDYEPTNCRWGTPKQQSRNTRQTAYLTAGGMTLPRADWVERTGIPVGTIRGRRRRGWSPERALGMNDSILRASATETSEAVVIPTSVSPDGLRARAKLVREMFRDEAGARHLELAADEIVRLKALRPGEDPALEATGYSTAIEKSTLEAKVTFVRGLKVLGYIVFSAEQVYDIGNHLLDLYDQLAGIK